MTREDLIRQAIAAQANWLEDVLAGLLINGVTANEVEIREVQSNPSRMEVWVRGKLKYGYRTIWKDGT